MQETFFAELDQSSTGGRYAARPTTAGPWAPDLQHGGPPNALAVTVAERVLAASSGRTDMVALRISSDFVGPVPVAELEVDVRVVRAARSAALVAVTISSGGRDCLHSRIWFVRAADTSTLADPLADAAVPQGDQGLDSDFPYARNLDWRRVVGGLHLPGPGTTWARPRTRLLDDHTMSGLARVVLVADSASGISAVLDWADWSFINVDLDVHLARPVEGDWVLMEATTQLGTHGSALAVSTLSDLHGRIGGGMQTLVLAPARR